MILKIHIKASVSMKAKNTLKNLLKKEKQHGPTLPIILLKHLTLKLSTDTLFLVKTVYSFMVKLISLIPKLQIYGFLLMKVGQMIMEILHKSLSALHLQQLDSSMLRHQLNGYVGTQMLVHVWHMILNGVQCSKEFLP